MDGVEEGQVARLTSGRRRLWWALLANAILCLGIGNLVVWGPLWWHWRVAPPEVTSEVIEANRSLPADSVLSTVAEMSMTTDHPLNGAAAVEAAQHLLRGELSLPHLPVVAIDPDFSPRDLTRGVPVQQVFTASLIVPDLLLRAHEYAPDPAYIPAALLYTRGFVDFEAGILLPHAFERNAHAVANRVSVLARLWRHTRQARDYKPETGRIIHLHAQRLGALLAKPSTFIASTNHGVMQNIGLLQLAVAFPTLPDAAEWRRLALRRLDMQLKGWIGSDGFALEHSAGYHFHAAELTGYVVSLMDMSGESVPQQWIDAHERTLTVLQALQRPDRSLPSYGDTYRYAWKLPAILQIDDHAWNLQLRTRDTFSRILPVSGNAIWWNAHSAAGVATHTHIPWGYFAGHGHRRAQELSLIIWADGTEWSTNTGYWPGEDDEGSSVADGWEGGNGPHVKGELPEAARRSVLLLHAESDGLRFLDLERSSAPESADALRVRRQLLQLNGGTWIVLDTYTDPNLRELQVLWTAAPETTQHRTAEHHYLLERSRSAVAMEMIIAGSPSVRSDPLRGSRAPFGGWVAYDRKAAPAPAIDARLASPAGWMLTAMHLRPVSAAQLQPALQATMTRYESPQNWTLALTTDRDRRSMEIERNGKVMILRTKAPARSASTRTLQLIPGTPQDTALGEVEQARTELMAAYPRYQTNVWQRNRYSLALLALWLSSTTGLVGLWMLWRRRYRSIAG